jgi:SpoVK/Ycf46/Vps4 family AAA+-type ATPase
MARADLIIDLVKAGLGSDTAKLRKTVEAMIAEDSDNRRSNLAERLQAVMRNSFTRLNPLEDSKVKDILFQIEPKRKLSDLVLSDDIRRICADVVEEQSKAELLREHNVEPRNRILLIGPPGNGKTSLAEALAEALDVPFYIVQYDNVINSFLGETGKEISKIIRFVSARKCVVFFDEFEMLGHERNNKEHIGEMKRVVASFLLHIDGLPSHTVIVGATNHSEMLDRAMWRRFQVRICLANPSVLRLGEWIELFEKKHGFVFGADDKGTITAKFHGSSFSDIEEFAFSVYRKYVLRKPHGQAREIVASTLKEWDERAARDTTC